MCKIFAPVDPFDKIFSPAQTATVPDELCKRANTLQFHDADIKFPLTRKLVRPASKSLKTTFKYVRPSVAI